MLSLDTSSVQPGGFLFGKLNVPREVVMFLLTD